MFKRSQKEASESSQNWYQDKYQHVLTQRNLLAVASLLALGVALVSVLVMLRLASLKTVEPYLLQVDEKTGITQKVNPITRTEYAASEAMDRYFASTYLRVRESYNATILPYNYNIVRLMSANNVFSDYRRMIDPNIEGSLAAYLGASGRRDVKIRSLAYINNPVAKGLRRDKKAKEAASNESYKILQAKITTTDVKVGGDAVEQQWIVTLTFEYANLAISESEQLLNPLGFQVIAYQIQREID